MEERIDKMTLCPKCKVRMDVQTMAIQRSRGLFKALIYFFSGYWIIGLLRGRKTDVKRIGTCPSCGKIVDISKREEKRMQWRALAVFGILIVVIWVIAFIKVTILKI